MNTLLVALGGFGYALALALVYRFYERRGFNGDVDAKAYAMACAALWPLWLVFALPRALVLTMERRWHARTTSRPEVPSKGPYR